MKHTILLAALALAGCRTAAPAGALVQPGPPGQDTRVISVARAVDLSAVGATAADVKFMQGMIAHHAQALEMTALVPARTNREEMRLIAKRIEASQVDEIDMMRGWLLAHGQPAPDPHAAHASHGASGPDAAHASHGALMPGMLTPDEMAQLAAAKGSEFDRLFLQLMIKHHAGALTMVEDLFAQPGAGQASDVFAFASDVDADQRMEIERMGAMINLFREQQQ